jgi:deoxyribodipyrimidine photo-lyase
LTREELQHPQRLLDGLPLKHKVAPVDYTGGTAAAESVLREFVEERLPRYGEEARHPDAHATSNLSPYLHCGHLAVHQVLEAVAQAEEWTPERLGSDASGKREGWWGMSPTAEAFLDELITWREVGYNFTSRRTDCDQLSCLPPWAQETLQKHISDPREYTYSAAELARAETHDRVWNAAQNQLRREGRVHSYLRMLWGKKILEWTRDPGEALQTMIQLNHLYALDAPNPNSYTGITWVLGRFDHAWGPERPVYGTVRYMTSEQTARKLRMAEYLRRFSSPD